jgi:hypothetical protein
MHVLFYLFQSNEKENEQPEHYLFSKVIGRYKDELCATKAYT